MIKVLGQTIVGALCIPLIVICLIAVVCFGCAMGLAEDYSVLGVS